jgi:lysophospholipase L1-like esterase
MRFRRDLNQLLKTVRPKTHSIVMFELPLFPFQNDYGLAQRSLAKEYHVPLIPRRYFVNVIGTPGATVDGIHLSASGQVLMAKLLSSVISSASE